MNITTEQYEGILNSAPPDHSSNEFLQFLRDHNVVIIETPEWLVIENVKYNTTNKPWYTAFDKGTDMVLDYKMQLLQWEFPEYRYILNSVFARTVKRFHVHLLKIDQEYINRSAMKILLFDIENTPLLGYAWGMYEQNILSVVKDTELLSFAHKINDEPIQVHSRRLYTERQLVKKLWELFNEADIIVGHNGDSFDIKMSNQYFLKYGLPPPSPYKSVDTKKMAKKAFRFAQNKLDYLGQFLFNERKIATNIDLWFKCMEGDESSLRKMEKYNIQDVVLLEKVYKTLRPWHTGHPNTNLYIGSTHKCPNCGGDTQKRGSMYTRVGIYQRHQCKACGAWSKGEKINIDKVIS